MDEYDHEKVEEIVMAYLTLHDTSRAWKGFDWETLDRLYEKGWRENPRGKALHNQLACFSGISASQRIHKTNQRIVACRASYDRTA